MLLELKATLMTKWEHYIEACYFNVIPFLKNLSDCILSKKEGILDFKQEEAGNKHERVNQDIVSEYSESDKKVGYTINKAINDDWSSRAWKIKLHISGEHLSRGPEF